LLCKLTFMKNRLKSLSNASLIILMLSFSLLSYHSSAQGPNAPAGASVISPNG
jgi:hypothetical protein